jgi:phage replication O-like protein O
MQSTAQVVNLQERRPVVKADVDTGYDRLAHDLTNAIASSDMSGREIRICLAIISKTYRFHKKTDWIANVQLGDITGISPNHIATIKQGLVDRQILIKEGRSIGINPVVSDWGDKVKSPENGSFNSRKRDTQKKTTNTKETNTKEKRAKSRLEIPENLPRESIELFIADRKARNKAMTEMAIKLFINRCLKAQMEGFNVTDLIYLAIEKGWTTIYPRNDFKPSRPKLAHSGFSEKDYGQTTANFDEVLS